ncbi:Holliday junction DNA helicase RuvA [hydrothermal vent metagenome]|uniref:Holliday junction DNA helicase RuvA n=1 Tax=hydrothermal vent metagenome TaxID=652676 RepID=A0A1W1CQ31_9ZZZZ
MIVGISGKILYKEPAFVHVDVLGIVYEVFISLQTFSALAQETTSLFTSQIFGFMDMNEKKMFTRLIKINGVGPKVAMAICSTYTPSQFATIISNKDLNGVKKVPGIGPKGAGRILVELAGFDVELISSGDGTASSSLAFSQATEALESLGFKKDKISKALTACEGDDTASLVKGALKLLQTV